MTPQKLCHKAARKKKGCSRFFFGRGKKVLKKEQDLLPVNFLFPEY
jgi:hypothetical protein